MAGSDSEVIKAAFKKFDKDNNGLITYEELEAVFKEIGGFANGDELRKIIESVDEDNDGCINFQEFLGLSMKLQSSLAENNLQTIFSEMDSDGDHFLTKSELQEGMSKFLGRAATDQEVEAAMKTLDLNQDGRVSYKEFAGNFLCRLHSILDSGSQ